MARISPQEHQQRLTRAARALDHAGVDCLFVLPGPNLFYLAGLRFVRERHRLLAALLFADGALVVLGPRFEEQKLGQSPVRPVAVVVWDDTDDQYRITAEQIIARSGPRPVVAVEPTTAYYHLQCLETALPGDARLRDGAAFTDRLRAIKSPSEIDCLREAARRTRARLERVPGQLAAGMTERDLVRLFGPGAMIQFGRTTANPNAVAGDRRLEPGDPIVIDAGDRVEGYRSDLTRTFFFDEPPPRAREVYRVVNEAELAAIEAARPGAPAEVIDLAARRVIEDAGYGEFFTHRGGHGIGLEFHEAPICAAGNREPLEPGMVLTAEPGIYLPGEIGVRLEDDILITDSGCELLCERGPLLA